jgi:hypothetical protein
LAVVPTVLAVLMVGTAGKKSKFHTKKKLEFNLRKRSSNSIKDGLNCCAVAHFATKNCFQSKTTSTYGIRGGKCG